MTWRLCVAVTSTLSLGSILFFLELIGAQNSVGQCSLNDQQCARQVNQLVNESYQQYRTPPQILQKRSNNITNTCDRGNLPNCNHLERKVESLQDSDVFKQLRESRQRSIEDSLQRPNN